MRIEVEVDLDLPQLSNLLLEQLNERLPDNGLIAAEVREMLEIAVNDLRVDRPQVTKCSLP